jgi:hypothetical protein
MVHFAMGFGEHIHNARADGANYSDNAFGAADRRSERVGDRNEKGGDECPKLWA